MKRYLPSLPFLFFLTLGCANTDYIDSDASPIDSEADSADTSVDDTNEYPDLPPLPDGFDIREPVVFAHDATALYKVEPETLTVSKIADFIWPSDPDKLTDLAIDKKGKMIGISRTAVYRIDSKTAQCEYLAPLTRHFVGLSFVPDEGIDSDDILVGIDKDGGQVDTIDPETGKAWSIGTFGKGLLASGDIVSVKDFGTVATVIDKESETDLLVHVDVKTGEATPIGDTGFSGIWGLGFWKDKLYGFTRVGEFILIDVKTGAGTLVQTDPEISWWGAGVTTKAPVIN